MPNDDIDTQAQALQAEWATDPRWRGTQRDYTPEQVVRLRPLLPMAYSLAQAGARRLWQLLASAPNVATFGALTGAQAVQMVKAGLQAIYLSGWQVAADGNLAVWHVLNYHTFQLAREYGQRGMSGYVDLQQAELAAEPDGYTAAQHQREAGTNYFDQVLNIVTAGTASTAALAGSTEAEQFQRAALAPAEEPR